MVRTAILGEAIIGAALFGAAIGLIGAPAAAAEPRATDFSAQQVKKKDGPPPKANVPVNRNVNVNRNLNVNRNVTVNRNTTVRSNKIVPQGGGNQQFKKVGGPTGPTGNQQQFKKLGGPTGPTGNQQQFKKLGGPTGPTGNQQQFKKFGGPLKAGPGKVVPFKAGNFPVVKLGNKVAPIWKGPKKLYWGGKWKTFIPLAALGAVAIGGAYYYADSYLTVARPYCEGITPEGCRLNWQRVDFEDGDSEWQCVSYCRRLGAPPPARTVALVAPPPMPQQGACELSIFSEPGFGGTNASSVDEQPNLGEIGWQNQIASLKVVAGTWDFFTQPEFTGDVVRYGPGEYPDLGPDWSRRTGSFMCVQP